MNGYELLKEELEKLQEKYKEITDKRAVEKLTAVYAFYGQEKVYKRFVIGTGFRRAQYVVIFININQRNC